MMIIPATVGANWSLCTQRRKSIEQDVVGERNVSAYGLFARRLTALSVIEAANAFWPF